MADAVHGSAAGFKAADASPDDALAAVVIPVDGLNIDAVYENFVRQIAGDVLQAATPQESLKESVARDDRRDALQKQINKLQAKIRKEKQLNRQMEMNAELKKLRRELEELNT